MAVRCKEMTERLKIIEDQEIEAIEAIDGGLEFELAACNQGLLNKVGRPGVLVKVDHRHRKPPWIGHQEAIVPEQRGRWPSGAKR